MTKKNWIYLSSVILIIIVAIVGMIAFVHFKYGNQTEDNTQKEVKIVKIYILQLSTKTNQLSIMEKRLN